MISLSIIINIIGIILTLCAVVPLFKAYKNDDEEAKTSATRHLIIIIALVSAVMFTFEHD